jgi:carbonic anhydrase/acetyltransferase-like protein (isoleucine patch superfamily)
MIWPFRGKTPKIDPSCFIALNATVIGDVEIGANSTVWPGAVIRADFGTIRIGSFVNVEDNCVLHGGGVLTIGDHVTMGHSVVVHCRSVGNNVLLGNNSTILDDAEIGDFSIIAAGAVVTPRMIVPPYSFVTGVPGVIQELTEEQRLRRRRRGPALAESGELSEQTGGYAQLAQEYKALGYGEQLD